MQEELPLEVGHAQRLREFSRLDLRDLLRALQAVRAGDSTARLPGHWTGLRAARTWLHREQKP